MRRDTTSLSGGTKRSGKRDGRTGKTLQHAEPLQLGEKIRFLVLGVPIGQPRVTHARRDGKRWAYVKRDHPIHAFREAVGLSARIAWRGGPLAGPLRLEATLVFPRPRNLVWKRKRMPRIPHQAKPDTDNVLKGIKDALKGILWRDDAQVSAESGEKWIAAGNEEPHVVILVSRVESTQPQPEESRDE